MSGFDPKQHFRQLSRSKKVKDANGRDAWENITSDYLDVKWRLVWLRDDCPDAEVETEMVERGQDFALFRARVIRPGRGSATGWGSETKGDFGDFIEKAETKALGRALAALGYGAAFCEDYDTGDSVVDSPVDQERQRNAVVSTAGDVATTSRPAAATAEELSGKAARSIPGALDDLRAAITHANASWADVKALSKRVYGSAEVTTLTSVQQIDALRGVVEDTHHEVQFDAGQSRIAVGPAPVGATT